MKKIAVAVALAMVVAGGYALAGTPFGGDDTGFVPPGTPKSDIAKCELKTLTNLRKAIDCIILAHFKEGQGKTNAASEETAENGDPTKSCLAKYNKAQSLLKGCPPCQNAASLYTAAEGFLDANNGNVFCASPSGAFIDGNANL